jgi:hypothetical protein
MAAIITGQALRGLLRGIQIAIGVNGALCIAAAVLIAAVLRLSPRLRRPRQTSDEQPAGSARPTGPWYGWAPPASDKAGKLTTIALGVWVDAAAAHPQYLEEIYEPRMAEATWPGASIATL